MKPTFGSHLRIGNNPRPSFERLSSSTPLKIASKDTLPLPSAATPRRKDGETDTPSLIKPATLPELPYMHYQGRSSPRQAYIATGLPSNLTSSRPIHSAPVRGSPVSQRPLISTSPKTSRSAAQHASGGPPVEYPPPLSPAPTESDVMSVTTMISTIPPSYRTRRSEDHEYVHLHGQLPHTIAPPPSAFMPTSGRRRETLTRPHGPRSDSRSRSRARAGGGTDADGQESGGGPYTRTEVREGRRALRKSLDGGIRLAGGPLGDDTTAEMAFALPPAYPEHV